MTDFTAYIGEPDYEPARRLIRKATNSDLPPSVRMALLEAATTMIDAALAGMETVTLSEEIRDCAVNTHWEETTSERRLVGPWEPVEE